MRRYGYGAWDAADDGSRRVVAPCGEAVIRISISISCERRAGGISETMSGRASVRGRG
ncbi:hypothetical protein BVI434_410030 [Burkholderia vietnamiensis]|nr:hypothetical protein BVI434_410030 [Burkholderia vietnamiensis]